MHIMNADHKRRIGVLVKKHNGWWEGDTARFPTVHDKVQFEAELHEPQRPEDSGEMPWPGKGGGAY